MFNLLRPPEKLIQSQWLCEIVKRGLHLGARIFSADGISISRDYASKISALPGYTESLRLKLQAHIQAFSGYINRHGVSIGFSFSNDKLLSYVAFSGSIPSAWLND